MTKTSTLTNASKLIRARTTKAGATVIQSKAGKSTDAPKVAASPMPTVATVGQTVAQINDSMAKAQAKQTKADKAAHASRPNPAVSAGMAPAADAPVAFGFAPTSQGLKLTHAIKDGFRPSLGAALFAHTSVFLTHSGIDKTPMSTKLVETFMGERAIAYHLGKENFAKVLDKRDASGNLVQRGGIILTPKGAAVFAGRIGTLDAELYSAFENVLCRGEADDRVIKDGDKSRIIQVAAK